MASLKDKMGLLRSFLSVTVRQRTGAFMSVIDMVDPLGYKEIRVGLGLKLELNLGFELGFSVGGRETRVEEQPEECWWLLVGRLK